MKYREAKLLKEGDQIIRKSDQVKFTIDSIALIGQYKEAIFTCTDLNGKKIELYNHEVDVLNG